MVIKPLGFIGNRKADEPSNSNVNERKIYMITCIYIYIYRVRGEKRWKRVDFP